LCNVLPITHFILLVMGKFELNIPEFPLDTRITKSIILQGRGKKEKITGTLELNIYKSSIL